MRVRRSTDNAETDVGWDAATAAYSVFADGTPLTAWIGAAPAEAFITTLYEQSGSGMHAAQDTATLQPKLNTTRRCINTRTSRYLPDRRVCWPVRSPPTLPFVIPFGSFTVAIRRPGARAPFGPPAKARHGLYDNAYEGSLFSCGPSNVHGAPRGPAPCALLELHRGDQHSRAGHLGHVAGRPPETGRRLTSAAPYDSGRTE